MKKIAFIINPKSGTKSKESLPDLIEKNLDKEKFEPLAEATDAEIVQVIGSKIVLYRESRKNKKIILPK